MQKRQVLIKIVSIIALVAFLVTSLYMAFAPIMADAISVSEAQRQQQQAKDKKDKAKKSQQEEIKKREKIDEQISQVQAQINALEEEIELKMLSVKKMEDKIDELTIEYKEQNKAYCERAKALIKKGGVSYTEIMLKSKSMDDMLTRMSVIKRVADYDSKKLDEIEKSMLEVEAMKQEVIKEKEKVLLLKEEQDEKKAELNKYKEESQKIIDDLQTDIEAFEREYERAKQAEAQARAQIQSMLNSNSYDLPANYTAGQFMWPSNTTRYVTSPYGYRIHPVTGVSRFHAGIDIGAAYGTSILASDAGVVMIAGYNAGGYGNYVVINHGGGYTTLYAHCSSLLVSQGQRVSRGQVIATCGSTGMSTGPHIHYEVQYNGKTTNPMQYFN